MDTVKIYGLCLERLKLQIDLAKKRVKGSPCAADQVVMMECYNTGESEDIIDIMELYDIEERTPEAVRTKLEELEYTVSVLLREKVRFGFTEEGQLGLYLVIAGSVSEEEDLSLENLAA